MSSLLAREDGPGGLVVSGTSHVAKLLGNMEIVKRHRNLCTYPKRIMAYEMKSEFLAL